MKQEFVIETRMVSTGLLLLGLLPFIVLLSPLCDLIPCY